MQILKWPNSALTHPENLESEDLPGTIKALIDTMKSVGAAGLAANQIGSGYRVIVLDKPESIIMIDPIILSQEGEAESDEGCFSLPEVRVLIKRAKTVVVEYMPYTSDSVPENRIKKTFSGLGASVVQHEIDHLEGKTLLDHLPRYLKDKAKMEMKQALRRKKKQGGVA